MRAPESSALGTKPRAPERATSGPKSDESRLETSTIAGSGAVGEARGDVEAVDVGQLDVEQHELRAQALGLGDAGRAVGGLADDVEPLGLEQHAGARPEGRVVVDDEDGQGHAGPIVNRVQHDLPIRLAAPPPRPRSRGTRRPDRRRRTPRSRRRTASRPPRRTRPAVLASTPPSTSSAGPGPISARRRSILPGLRGRNAWPPQPGLTVMQSARSRSSASSESASTGVAGVARRRRGSPRP